MENRKNLHDYSLVMILLAVLGTFNFALTIVRSIVDGTVSEAFATVDASILTAVKICFGIVVALLALLAFAEAFIGLKGLKVSREPNADKGYITITKIFLVMNVIVVPYYVLALVNNTAPVVDTVFSLLNAGIDIVIYALFIKHATAVRQDFIATK